MEKKSNHKKTNGDSKHQASKKIDYKPFILISVILIITFIIYFPVFSFDFVNWDDDRYVTDNPYLKDFSWSKVINYFTDFYFSMYLPITMLTYSIDFYIGGMDATIFHATSIIFHLINTCLLFIFIRTFCKLLGFRYLNESAIIVSLLFAIHPIHLESVAWIAERKDVVYTAFYFATLIFYLNYSKSGKLHNYLIALLLFLISLISKAQAMPLSIIIVLIDWMLSKELFTKRNILEKIPFFILSIFFGIIAILATREDKVSSNAAIGITGKLVYGSYSFITYIVKLIIPYKLAVIYPYPEEVSKPAPFIYWLYLIPTSAILFSIVYFFKKSKEYIFGIMFFAANIFIVLQVFAYHNFIMADRYTYVSSVGIFFLIAFLYEKFLSKKAFLQKISIILFIAYIIFLLVFTHFRQKVWKNSFTLWDDEKSKYPEVIISYYNCGNAYLYSERYQEAIANYSDAIRYKPDHTAALANRGIAYARSGNTVNSLQDFEKVLKLDSLYRDVYSNRGNVMMMLGNINDAIKDYSKAIEIDSNYLDALTNRGMALIQTQQWQLAEKDFIRLEKINPKNLNVHYNLGAIWLALNKKQEALQKFNLVLANQPNNIDALFNRAVISEESNLQNALTDYNLIITIKPDIAVPYFRRALIYLKLNNSQSACNDFRQSLKLGYKFSEEWINKYCK